MKYPSYEALLKIHKKQILQFGGSYGIRDEHLLRSAYQQPQKLNHFYFYDKFL